jgi:hypothetical protein
MSLMYIGKYRSAASAERFWIYFIFILLFGFQVSWVIFTPRKYQLYVDQLSLKNKQKGCHQIEKDHIDSFEVYFYRRWKYYRIHVNNWFSLAYYCTCELFTPKIRYWVRKFTKTTAQLVHNRICCSLMVKRSRHQSCG